MALGAVEDASQMLKFTQCFGEGMGPAFCSVEWCLGNPGEDSLGRGWAPGKLEAEEITGWASPPPRCEHLPFGSTRAGISCCSWVKGNWKEDPRRLGIPRQEARPEAEVSPAVPPPPTPT